MKPVRLGSVKKEIRVLGIATCRRPESYLTVGAVFRGARWLDGVMTTQTWEPDLTPSLIEMVAESPHHPQIRVIMTHENLTPSGSSIDHYKLSQETRKPVISLTGSGLLHENIDKGSADRVLRTSIREGDMPEALRVASLIASTLSVSG